MRKEYFICFSILIYAIIGFPNHRVLAQEANKVISPPPTAAGLGKYGDIPISLYTGIPNINIPLWEISGKQIKLPISLSYHASGIKVEENASWVGLGWSLNAGGVITRSVRGKSDEDIGGYLLTPEFPTYPTMENFFNHVMEGTVDTEPDIFFYNFNGKAGKFLIAKDQKVYTIPHSDLDIKVEAGARKIDKITIRGDEGTQYIFGLSAAEETISKTYYYDLSISAENYKHDSRRNAITSWYLKEIISVSGKEVITFHYTDEHYSYESSRKGKYNYRKDGTIVSRMVTQSESEVYGKRLMGIDYTLDGKSIERVEFKADKDREDLKQISIDKKPKALTSITITNSENIPVRNFNFNTDYFNAATGPAAPINHYLYKRLKLLSLTELSGDGAQSKPPYIFTYDNTELPPKDATTQDHWGFYNGKSVASNDGFHSPYNMVPAFEGPVDNSKEHLTYHKKDGDCQPIDIPLESVAYVKLPGDNREPSFPAMQAGILTGIQYPTGGSSTFEYEPHDYGYIGDKKETKEIYFKTTPSANIERPWDNKDSTDVLISTKNEVIRDNDIVLKPADADPGKNYKTIRLEYIVEYAYEDKEKYEGNYAYTFNEVSLFKAGVNKPLIKVFYSYGKIYLQRFDPDTSPETSIETLTPTLLDTRDYTLSPGPEGYATAKVRGYVDVRLDIGVKYFLESQRYYPEDGYQRRFGYVNNTAALIAFVTPISGGDPVVKTSFMAGGLRIKKMTDQVYAEQPALIKDYSYKLPDDKNVLRSSGDLISLPQHITGKYHFSTWVTTTGSMGDKCGWSDNFLSYLVLEVNSEYSVPLASTQGSHLGYRQVKVSQEGNGYTIYHYSSGVDAPDSYPEKYFWTWGDDYVGSHNVSEATAQYIYPFIPAESNDWKRGLLLNTVNFNDNGEKIKEELNSYNFKVVKSLPGMVVFFSAIQQRWLYEDRWAEYTKYDLPISTVLLDSKEIITYTEGFSHNSIKTTFSYSPNHVNPVTSASTTMIGNRAAKSLISYTTYPKDYRPGTPFIDDMVNNNLVSVPIEKIVYQDYQSGSVGVQSKKVVSGEITTYLPGGKGFKHEVWDLETAQPVLLTDFKFSNQYQGAGEPTLEGKTIFKKDANYKRRLTFEWDQNSGNIKQLNKMDDIPISYKWNDDHSLPIAEVKNAHAGQIFYTSFETAGIESYQAKTGRRIFNGSYDLILPALNGKYLLTYWQKPADSQEWEYIVETVVITESAVRNKSIGGDGINLDEVRLFPVDAVMATYTYDPLIGMTSSTDANNITTYYEYDGFGRLSLVKDDKGNILNKYDYQYAGQPPKPTR